MSPPTPPPTRSAAIAAYVEETLRHPLAARLLLDATRAVCVLDPSGTVIFANDQALGAAGLPAEQILNQPIWAAGSHHGVQDARARWEERLLAAGQSAEPMASEQRYELRDGQELQVYTELSPILGDAATVIGFFVRTVDVDRASRAEAGLREQQALRQLVFDQALQFIGILDPDGTVLDVNAAVRTSSFTSDAIIGHRIQDLARAALGGDTVGDLWQGRIDALRGGADALRFIDMRADGVDSGMPLQAFECAMTPVRDAEGTLQTILIEVQDRTVEYQIEQRLLASEEQFRAMAEALPQMAWIVRETGSYQYFAPRWTEFTGASMEHLLEHGVNEFIHPDDREEAANFRAAPDGHAPPLVFRMRRHDGAYRWMEARLAVVPDGDGDDARWFGVTLDITERFERELEARMQQEQLRGTLELTGMGTYVWLVQEDRFSRDSQLEQILGVPMESMMTGNAFEQFFAIVHAEDREAAQASVLGALVPGGPDYQAQFRIIRPSDGGYEERWVSAMGTVEFDERGEALRLVGVFSDITEKRLEDDGQLRLQKMEAIGTLASGIAHDFNNVIGAILSYARVAEAELRAGESPATSIAEIARGAHRAGDIVRRLLTFSREDEPRRIAFDLVGVVQEAETLVRPSVPGAVAIRSTFADGLPAAIGDPTQLHQVVVNLLTNAGHALGESGGVIEITVDAVTVRERSSGITNKLKAGEYLCIAIVDDGPGMTDAVAKRIFDPFFTTKTASDGTGLGLAAVQSIAKNHGGSVAVETSPGNGARFTVHIPAATGDVPDERRPEPTGPLPDVPETVRVLFVDDEQALVRLAYRAMPYHGCEVVGFTDPRDAVEAFERDPFAFDAVITDYSMPGFTGLDLTDRVKAIRPGVPVVLTSGYMGGESHAEAERRGVGAVVPKPCSIDTLAAEVFRLLERS